MAKQVRCDNLAIDHDGGADTCADTDKDGVRISVAERDLAERGGLSVIQHQFSRAGDAECFCRVDVVPVEVGSAEDATVVADKTRARNREPGAHGSVRALTTLDGPVDMEQHRFASRAAHFNAGQLREA